VFSFTGRYVPDDPLWMEAARTRQWIRTTPPVWHFSAVAGLGRSRL